MYYLISQITGEDDVMVVFFCIPSKKSQSSNDMEMNYQIMYIPQKRTHQFFTRSSES